VTLMFHGMEDRSQSPLSPSPACAYRNLLRHQNVILASPRDLAFYCLLIALGHLAEITAK
jgi:hypothetical protein